MMFQNFKIDNDNLESKEKENESPKDEKIADLTNQENPNSSEKEPEIHVSKHLKM